MTTTPPPVPRPAPSKPSGRLWIVTGVLALVAGGVTLAVLQPWKKPPPVPAWKRASILSKCSDTARRPLAERIVMWAQRLRSAA